MSQIKWEKPADWRERYVSEARSSLERLAEQNGSILVHLFESEKEFTVDSSKVLSLLMKCVCGSKELSSCTCPSSLYQDQKGVFHFVTHSLVFEMDAQGEVKNRAIAEAVSVN